MGSSRTDIGVSQRDITDSYHRELEKVGLIVNACTIIGFQQKEITNSFHRELCKLAWWQMMS